MLQLIILEMNYNFSGFIGFQSDLFFFKIDYL